MKERFLAKVRIDDEDGCWWFTGAKNSDGYGSINIGGRVLSAHRVAYELFMGTIPEGKSILHTCDNRCCVNPVHLFLGTQYDNVRDMIGKGRQNFNGKLPYLSNEHVQEIRALLAQGLSQHKLSKMYHVSQGVIFKVKHGQGCYR